MSEESERLHREESDLILIGGGIRRAQKKRSSLHSAHVGLGWFTQLFWQGMKINSVNLPYRLDLFLLWVINQTFFLKNHWLQISIVKVARLYFSLSYWPWRVAKKSLESGELSYFSSGVRETLWRGLMSHTFSFLSFLLLQLSPQRRLFPLPDRPRPQLLIAWFIVPQFLLSFRVQSNSCSCCLKWKSTFFSNGLSKSILLFSTPLVVRVVHSYSNLLFVLLPEFVTSLT